MAPHSANVIAETINLLSGDGIKTQIYKENIRNIIVAISASMVFSANTDIPILEIQKVRAPLGIVVGNSQAIHRRGYFPLIKLQPQ